MQLIWIPLFSWPLLYSLAGLTLLLSLYSILKKNYNFIWRSIALLIALIWLSGAQLLHETIEPQTQDVLIVTDTSSSVNIGERSHLIQQAQRDIEQQEKTLSHVSFHHIDVSNGPQGTRLFESIEHEIINLPHPSAIILLTDGMVHDTPTHVPPFLYDTAGHIIPIHTLLSAHHEETDRTIRVLNAPPYAIVGQETHIRIEIDDQGSTEEHNVDLMEHHNGAPPTLLAHTITGHPIDISLPVTHTGLIFKEIYATPLPGEASLRNNHTIIRLQGIRDKLRVLLVSGVPNQGARTWRTLLKADPSVDLVHFTILRSPDSENDTPPSDLALIPFPTHELFSQKINSFDLIILDGFRNQGILPDAYLNNIARYVRQGGGLLIVSGPEITQAGSLQDTPIHDILPVHIPEHDALLIESFTPQRTSLGLSHPVTSTLPTEGTWGKEWGPWYRALIPDHTQGKTLLSTSKGSPLLVLNQTEKGRVAMLLSDQIWLWSRSENKGGPQAELLRHLAHWLMKEPELEENRLETHTDHNMIVVNRYSTDTSPPPPVEITSPSGEKISLPLKETSSKGVFQGHFSLPNNENNDGYIWTLKQGDLTAFVVPENINSIENDDLRSTATHLAPLLKKSGGGLFWLGEHATPKIQQVPEQKSSFYGDNWIGLPLHIIHSADQNSATPILPHWIFLSCILFFLGLGWWREGR